MARINTTLSNHQCKSMMKLTRILLLPCIFHVSLAFSTSSPHSKNQVDALVCGGGPSGLLSAIMLAQKFPDYKISVYDRQPISPPSPNDDQVWCDFSRYYLIGLGGRGITSLETFGVWEDVKKYCIEISGRMDWNPGNDEPATRFLSERKYLAHVLPRDKLVSVLHQHVVEKYADKINLNYGYEVRPTSFCSGQDGNEVLVEIAKVDSSNERKVQMISSGLVIASDGTARTFANQIEQDDKRSGAKDPFSVVRYEDENQRVYKIIDFKVAPGWRKDLNYAVRTEESKVIFDALPANENGDYCGNLLFKKGDEMAQPTDPKKFREFLDKILPQFSPMFDDKAVAQVAQAPPSLLPMFRYVTPRMHQGNRCVLLGDCAHTVKPYFGLGCNSALEDVKILGEFIDNSSDLTNAIVGFSKMRSPDIERMVKVSHDLDKPGVQGVFTFLIPVILDAIFHKAAPSIFSQNIIAMLQTEDMTFQQVADQKRLERIAQLAILGLLFALLANVSQLVFSWLS